METKCQRPDGQCPNGDLGYNAFDGGMDSFCFFVCHGARLDGLKPVSFRSVREIGEVASEYDPLAEKRR